MFSVSYEEEELCQNAGNNKKKKAADALMTVTLWERVKPYECAINKGPPSNWCTTTSITSIRCSVEWPSIHCTIHSHQFSLSDNPIGAFRGVCCEPLRETLTTPYHWNYTRVLVPLTKKLRGGNHTYFRRAEKLQAVRCDRKPQHSATGSLMPPHDSIFN